MALTTTAMSLQQLHLQTFQIQNRLRQQTQADYLNLHPLQPTMTWTWSTHFLPMLVSIYPRPDYHNLQSLTGTTPPFQEWKPEPRNFLSINNYDSTSSYDRWTTLCNQTERSPYRMLRILLQEVEREEMNYKQMREHKTYYKKNWIYQSMNDETVELTELSEVMLMYYKQPTTDFRDEYNEVLDRVSQWDDYLNYVLIHGTKLGTEANNHVRRLQRSTNGFEALRLLRLRYSGVQTLQNYQLLRELLNPKFTEAQQHYQYRQWLELLSRYELEAAQPLDDNLKIATLLNGLRGSLQQHLQLSVKPTSTRQNVREIVRELPQFQVCPQSYYWTHCLPSSWFWRQRELHQRKEKRKGRGKGGKGKKGGDNYKGKGKSKGKGKQGDYHKGKGKGYNKGGKGNYYQGSSWNKHIMELPTRLTTRSTRKRKK